VRGRVLSAYANDNTRPYAGGMHRGIDIAADPGAPVVAARAGTVTYAGPLGSSGVVVAIRTEDDRHVTSYLHLGAVSVERGQRLAAGARVGVAGTSGRRSVAEPHLHFGVRLAHVEDHYVDPLSLLPPLGGAAEPGSAAPAPAPARVQPEPALVPVAVRAAPAARPQRALTRPRGTLLPGPVPAIASARRSGAAPARRAAPGAAAGRVRVPAGPIAQRQHARLRHPTPGPAPFARPLPAAGRGRPLVLAGLGLIALLLFGGAAVRANSAANACLFRAVCRGRRVLTAARAQLPQPPAGRG
jgi:hypothetical protein